MVKPGARKLGAAFGRHISVRLRPDERGRGAIGRGPEVTLRLLLAVAGRG